MSSGSTCYYFTSQSRTIREFDANLTVKMFGFTSVEDFYSSASPISKISSVRIPVLCLNAADDPFVPSHCESVFSLLT